MNVMKRAWEIAKAAVAKFGGKVKEYFAQALRMSWAEAKTGFTEIKKLNGMLYFAVNDIAGMTVSYLTTHRNPYNGKTYTKKHKIDYQVVNTTKRRVRIYAISMSNEAIEIQIGNIVKILSILHGKLEGSY